MKLAAWIVAVFWIGLCGASAQEPTVTLIAPSTTGKAGAEAQLDVVALNSGQAAVPLVLPAQLQARLIGAGAEQRVTLQALDTALAGSVPAGGFVRVRYRYTLPADVTEQTVLVLDAPVRARVVLEVSPNAQPVAAQVAASDGDDRTQGRSRAGLVPRPAAAQLDRAFRQHFGTHEPVYFIYGPNDDGAKFQISFRYRVVGDAADAPESTRNSVQFGYTQRSLWDIEAESSPFRDTSYMPEIFYEHLAPEDLSRGGGLKWLGAQIGYKHESNGRDALNSRSMNTLFLRSAVAFGRLDGWRVILEPRAHTYIGDMTDNPDMKKYRGHGEVRMIVGENDGVELMLTARAGSDWEHRTFQADLTIPIRFRLGDFASYFLVQYFNGYGESLLNYREHEESIRGGFSFVR
jgi:phospholipase A1/A2